MIDSNATLYDLLTEHPELIPVFTANGFEQVTEPEKLATIGRRLTLEQAVKLKNKSLSSFLELLHEVYTPSKQHFTETLTFSAALPCPVKTPLEEGVATIAALLAEQGIDLQSDLRAASQGVDWIADSMTELDGMRDLYLSAGFDAFMEESRFRKRAQTTAYVAALETTTVNDSFNQMGIMDPNQVYGVIAVVPAVFMVNRNLLGDLPVPTTWDELLSEPYAGKVALPVGDFDLFNSILITLHKIYGLDGIHRLKRAMHESLHPAQMVKSGQQKNSSHAITVLPYFFTRMIMPGSRMEVVWPTDGAIISPIFMTAKESAVEKCRPLTQFLNSAEVGEILSHRGLFPSTHPGVDNRLNADQKFIWVGWDYIYSINVEETLKRCLDVFHN